MTPITPRRIWWYLTTSRRQRQAVAAAEQIVRNYQSFEARRIRRLTGFTLRDPDFQQRMSDLIRRIIDRRERGF